MKCSELTRLLWSHSVQDRGQAVCVFSFGSVINDEGSTWSFGLVTEQPGSIQKGLEVWAFGNQRSFRISVEIIHWGGFERHKGLKIILNQYLTGHDMMAVMVEMVYNLDMSHTTLPQTLSVQADLLTLRQMLHSSSLHLLRATTRIYIFQPSPVYIPQRLRRPAFLWQ